MGNSHSANEFKVWKGPFSDAEYECLATKYAEMTQGAKAIPTVHSKLQNWLTVSVDNDAPVELAARLQGLGRAFYIFCVQLRDAEEGRQISAEAAAISSLALSDFVKGVAACVRASSQSVASSLFRLLCGCDQQALDENQLIPLFFSCLAMANEVAATEDYHRFVHVAKNLAHAAVAFRADTTDTTKIMVHADAFVGFLNGQLPLFYSIFTSWMVQKCFGSLAKPSYHAPALSHKSDILSSAHFIVLSSVATPLQSTIDRLYTTAQDGLSFNRLCYHILGYTGPTMLVIRDTGGAVFGMFCDAEWKESSRYYGSNGCFLFRLEPHINIYRVTSSGSNENYMYLNTKGFALPRGLGMGGSTNAFRLFLSEDFDENCYSSAKDLSFENGPLSSASNEASASGSQFFIEAMEVWGCGGDEGRRNQKARRQETADLIDRARKVDKAQFLGNDFDKEFFLSKTFGHSTDKSRIADDEH